MCGERLTSRKDEKLRGFDQRFDMFGFVVLLYNKLQNIEDINQVRSPALIILI